MDIDKYHKFKIPVNIVGAVRNWKKCNAIFNYGHTRKDMVIHVNWGKNWQVRGSQSENFSLTCKKTQKVFKKCRNQSLHARIKSEHDWNVWALLLDSWGRLNCWTVITWISEYLTGIEWILERLFEVDCRIMSWRIWNRGWDKKFKNWSEILPTHIFSDMNLSCFPIRRQSI